MLHIWYTNRSVIEEGFYELYYHGRPVKEAYYRGEQIWGNPAYTLTFLTGTSRVSAGSVLEAEYDTFVSRVSIRTDSRVQLQYIYGPSNEEAWTEETRIVEASDEMQNVYHVVQTPEPYLMNSFSGPYFRYSVYLRERDDMTIHFDARFMSFPYTIGKESGTYPGRPEDVTGWWVRTVR